MTVQPVRDVAPIDLIVPPRITVVGVGGAGGNAINNMIRANLGGVEFVAANTDAQALEQSLCGLRILLGANLTHGLGAGSRPEIGQAAAEEANDAIVDALRGVNMAFITAGMGGGTGTGGAPVIARVAREQGVLAVGVVSKPFNFEGPHRMRQAEAGIAELAQHVDTLIVVPNQNLFRVADEKTTLAGAFKLADEVLHTNVRGVTDLMVLPGLVNLDFADVRSIMEGMGKAVMGTGEAGGDNRALAAAKTAISNPLLDGISMTGARSVLINITGGADLKLMEVDEAANRIRGEVDPDANIIFGSAFSETLDGKIRVSVIATSAETMVGVEAGSGPPPALARPPEREAQIGDVLPGSLAKPSEPTAEAKLEQDLIKLRRLLTAAQAGFPPGPHSRSKLRHKGAGSSVPKPPIVRSAKPVKTQSTLEAVEESRKQEETTEPSAEKMLFMVGQTEVGARIYKVPEGKVASIGSRPDAGKWKMFRDLEKAKVEVNAIFKRVAADRAAKGLPASILEPTLKDLMRRAEKNVPDFFD